MYHDKDCIITPKHTHQHVKSYLKDVLSNVFALFAIIEITSRYVFSTHYEITENITYYLIMYQVVVSQVILFLCCYPVYAAS